MIPRKDSEDGLKIDRALEETLRNFRSSAHAWSDGVYNQPHRPVKVYTTSWRVATSWALGCALAIATVSGSLYERHHLKEQAKIAAAAEAARQQKIEAEQKASEELAKIDSDVSREVPSAMEPL